MQSPKRALLYGLGIWFIWVSLVVIAVQIVPAEGGGSTLFGSMSGVTLAAITLGFAILYPRQATQGSFTEGLLVGLSWVVIMVALDLAHYFMVPFDVGAYFLNAAPLPYIIMPIITTLTMGYLAPRLQPQIPLENSAAHEAPHPPRRFAAGTPRFD